MEWILKYYLFTSVSMLNRTLCFDEVSVAENTCSSTQYFGKHKKTYTSLRLYNQLCAF